MPKASALSRVERKLRSLDKWMPPQSKQSKTKVAPRTPLSFRNFVNTVYPRYVWYRHCEVLAARLQDMADAKINRLMVFMPPRGGKSILVSRLFPAYLLYCYPEKFVAIASYGMELAQTFSRSARQLFEDAGGVLRQDVRSVKHWETPQGGGLWAAGVGGSATGKGFSFGIVDDPIKSAEEAGSETIREKHKDWYGSVFYTRAEPESGIIVCQTRWHEDDLSGWLLAQEEFEPEHWHVVNFEALKSEVLTQFPESCTVESDWRSPGEALCPERYDVKKLTKIRGKIGEYFWAALYCQQPRPLEGNLIKISWFGRYRVPPDNPTMVVLSWDTASKAKELSAYSVCGVWFVTETGFYLVDVWRDRVEMPALERMVISLGERWNPNAILIEDKASGTGVIQLVQAKAWLPIVPIEPDGDKLTRLSVESPAIESGRVWLPEHAPWLPEFEKELLSAPNGAYMDQADMLSQFLCWMRSQYTQFEFSSSGKRRKSDTIDDYLRHG
jgi:predicted phage terminase large subunit-like protein